MSRTKSEEIEADESGVGFWDYANTSPRHNEFLSIKELMKELHEMAGDDLPDSIVVIGYGLKKINIDEMANWILEKLLERLDENYASYDDCGISIPTKKMKEAAIEFIKQVAKDYKVGVYEVKCKKIVHPKDYLEDVK